MAKLSGIVKQLKKERDRVEQQLSALNAALSAFVGAYKGTKPTRKRRKLSAKGRANIVAAQRARWAKIRCPKKKVVHEACVLDCIVQNTGLNPVMGLWQVKKWNLCRLWKQVLCGLHLLLCHAI
jgi:hypothetical protein